MPARVITTISVARLRWSSNARSDTASARATENLGDEVPPKSWAIFSGDRATARALAHMSRSLGRSLSLASRRSLGTASTRPVTTATATTTARMIHTVFEFPPDSGVTSRWMALQARGSEMTNRTPLTNQLAAVTDALELIATDGVVALLLEEPDSGGEDRRGTAGDAAEAVGDLEAEDAVERQVAGHAAEVLHRGGGKGQLGEDERRDDPHPVGADDGVERTGDVDEDADERPATDQGADDEDRGWPS